MAKSKVAQNKEQMGWRKKGPTCSNCTHFTSDIREKRTKYGAWEEEANKRCSLGVFATGKSSWCRRHEFAE